MKNKKFINLKMEVRNFAWNQNQSKRCTHPWLPKVIRGLIIGKSGCGKITLLINVLLRPGWLDYNIINIFGKSLYQPEYHILMKPFEEKLPKKVIIRLFENQNNKTNLDISSYQLLKKWRKRLESNLMLSANFSIGWRCSRP